MKGEKNVKKTVWLYAVILFSSAFVVLLLTAYSQIKFNKNITEYKNQIYTGEKEKKDYKTNLSQTLDENKVLKEDVKRINSELTKLKNDQESLKKGLEDGQNKLNQSVISYDGLIDAENSYNNGDITSCALTLKNKVDVQLLGKSAQEKYNSLINKTLKDSAFKLYYKGLDLYKKKKYDEAIESFKQSLSLTTEEDYSDDCYYFVAYSYFRKNDNNTSANFLSEMLKNYPGSDYYEDAQELLKKVSP